MLLDAKLPKKFWAEGVSIAVYFKNRSMMPYKVWNGRKPKVNHLRVSGSDVYTHVPRDERGKFDSKTRKCIMVGYGMVTKGYRLYGPIDRKTVHSRDVQFNEIVKESVVKMHRMSMTMNID